jgi:N-acyl-D-amino-acid deacylase
MHDLVIRDGKIVDGSGRAAFTGDIAIDGDVITSVGGKAGAGRREINAGGALITPGWVDIHTHYDGQVTWDPYVTPSSWHGVTTIVMGNCGVGFAPVKRGEEEFLIGLMEGVEDIPGDALAQGIKWDWESFPQYLDALAAMKRAIDIGAQVPHGAVRAYVMGERGAHNEDATGDDIARMAAIVREAMAAGAVGFSTSRTVLHRAKNKEFVPGTSAREAEVLGIGRVLGEVGHGVFEMASDLVGPDASMGWMTRLSRESGRPIALLATRPDPGPMDFTSLLRQVRECNRNGAHIVPLVPARWPSLLVGLQTSFHPFVTHRTYRSLGNLSLDEKVARMRDPQLRARILAEGPAARNELMVSFVHAFDRIFPLGDPPDYEPPAEMSIAARARREGKSPEELTYDLLLQRDGRELLYMPTSNYEQYNLETVRELLVDPMTVVGLSDGGAHCGIICDASMPTFLLSHWVRDRRRGERIPLELAVRRQTRETAEFFGMPDRGLLAAGMKADVNVIDFERIQLRPPQMVFDFPAGARRLIQKADGYRYTVVSGEVIFHDGEPTGAMPGKLVRGGQTANFSAAR